MKRLKRFAYTFLILLAFIATVAFMIYFIGGKTPTIEDYNPEIAGYTFRFMLMFSTIAAICPEDLFLPASMGIIGPL